MGNDVLVSIDCLTYNHGDYIAETIEGFLMQKTDFKFEILIHDDASTDHTAEVIRHYERKYPDLIKPIYQKENLHSQGIAVDQINVERAKGKYMALCEGDDYWEDPYKLQKQVDYLEAHPECSLCVHAARRYSEMNKKFISQVRPGRRNRIFSIEEVIDGGGELFPTNSMVYRKEFSQNIPLFYFETGVGDYPLTIHLAMNGTVFYIDEFMSVYRVDVKGSWSDRNLSNIIKIEEQHTETVKLLEMINSHTDFKYDEAFRRTIKKNHFYLLLKQHKYKEAFIKEHKEFYLHMEFIQRASKKFIKVPQIWKSADIRFSGK